MHVCYTCDASVCTCICLYSFIHSELTLKSLSEALLPNLLMRLDAIWLMLVSLTDADLADDELMEFGIAGNLHVEQHLERMELLQLHTAHSITICG